MYLQVLAMYDRLDAIDVEGVVRFVKAMQQENGSFFGEEDLNQFYNWFIRYLLLCKTNLTPAILFI